MAIYFLFFGCNFFCVKNRENFLLSTDRNMVFLQILSDIPLLYDQWLPRYVNYPPRPHLRLHLGGFRMENGGNPPKTNFKQVLDHLPGFENNTLFSIHKKNFFHSTLLWKDQILNRNWFSSARINKFTLKFMKSLWWRHCQVFVFQKWRTLY